MGDLDKLSLSSPSSSSTSGEGGGVEEGGVVIKASVTSPRILLCSKFFILNAMAMSTVVFSVNFGVNWAVTTSNPMKQMTFSIMDAGITWAFLAAITILRFSTSCVHYSRIRRGVDAPLQNAWYTSHIIIRTCLFSLGVIQWRLPAFILNVLLLLSIPLTMFELFSCAAKDDFNGLKCHEPVRWKFCAGNAAGKAICAAIITMMNYIATHNDLRFKTSNRRQDVAISNTTYAADINIITTTATATVPPAKVARDRGCVGREQQQELGTSGEGNLQCQCLLDKECCV